MTTTTVSHTDARPLWLRLTVWAGLVLLSLFAPLFIAFSAVAGAPAGWFLLCFGLLVLVGAVGGVAREVTERRLVREPPQPRLETMPDGEPALFLPRATGPTRISCWTLAGFGMVLLLGAALAAVERSWGLALVLLLSGGWFVLTAVPHRVTEMAGGTWLTPTRVVDAYRGVRWEVPWEFVTGVAASHPQRVLLVVHRDRVPVLECTGPRGRAWKPLRAGNVLVIDTHHLAGGSAHLGRLLETALEDADSRKGLGRP